MDLEKYNHTYNIFPAGVIYMRTDVLTDMLVPVS